jgi:hypothetical protein
MGTRCYLGRVPFKAVERDVENFFRGYGRINDVSVHDSLQFHANCRSFSKMALRLLNLANIVTPMMRRMI